jgi:integrase
VEPADLDFARGEVTVRRVKKRGNSYPVDVVALPDRVIEAVEAMPTRSRQLDGPLFRTVDGKPIVKGALRYYWDPVRSVFQAQVSPERWRELLAGQKNQETLDFYSLRHFCASLIVDRGGNEFDVSAQLGNSPEVARETYIHAYRDRVNDRNRSRLNGPVADLDAARRRRLA